jgi:hypothetical protein
MTLAEWRKLKGIYVKVYEELDVDFVSAAFTRSVIDIAAQRAQREGMEVSERDVRREQLLARGLSPSNRRPYHIVPMY